MTNKDRCLGQKRCVTVEIVGSLLEAECSVVGKKRWLDVLGSVGAHEIDKAMVGVFSD